MFGQCELPEPFDGVVVDGVVDVDGVVVVAVLEDDVPLDDVPVAAFAIATTPPASAPVASTVAAAFLSLVTFASFPRFRLLVDPISRDGPGSSLGSGGGFARRRYARAHAARSRRRPW